MTNNVPAIVMASNLWITFGESTDIQSQTTLKPDKWSGKVLKKNWAK